jgi:endogenous inhibitor of DNA gyrase (YacG/DUF329 family)
MRLCLFRSVSLMATLVCPVCKAKFDSQASTAMPFCSDRCRNIDLSRWLGENYSIPVAPDEDPDEEPPPE